MDNYKFLFKKLILVIITFILINPTDIISQEKFLLKEDDLPGYELISQSKNHWLDSQGEIYWAISQRWRPINSSDTEDIYIEYNEFASETKAITVTSYHAGSFAERHIWGAFSGSIVGDHCWIGSSGSGIIFTRGNVGIQLFKPILPTDNDRNTLTTIAHKILNKIEVNLPPEILALEQAAKQKQISLAEFNQITTAVVNSSLMSNFSVLTSYDSKWLVDSTTLVIGRRTEWKNDSGVLMGIDICQLANAEQATLAVTIQSRQTYSPIFNIDSLTALQQIIDEWQTWQKFGQEENHFAVVSAKGNLTVQVYQFDSTKINTDFAYDIIKILTAQILNF
ncbi:hypothetical protein JW964_28305 [candidate division KSB1 bacterium]|nr:hypothetical protein [candidate division KSB1 bacterium]